MFEDALNTFTSLFTIYSDIETIQINKDSTISILIFGKNNTFKNVIEMLEYLETRTED